MSWKSILVHHKAYQDWSSSIDVAIGLAQKFDARLSGLYTLRELAMLKLILGADSKTAQEAQARDAPLMAKAETRFREACTKATVKADWDFAEGNAHELLAFAGRCHDLVVVEQSPGGLDGLGTDVVEECVVACGTPTLIVPRKGQPNAIGKRVVIAWNHSKQSAAAMHGALPLIVRAEKVVVLLGKERDAMSSVTRRPEVDVGSYLRQHVAQVDVVPFETSDGEAGQKLLAAVSGARGDVLVMGAYGRSAWREFVFGGATRYVLGNLNVPVLMAH